MSLLEEYDGPVPYRPKIPCHLQIGMLKLEGITGYGLPDDWETKRLHLKAATETAEDVDSVAEFLRGQGFTEIRTHTGGDPRIYAPGVVSWNQPYSRLLALDAIANLDGVTRIDRIREARPARRNGPGKIDWRDGVVRTAAPVAVGQRGGAIFG